MASRTAVSPETEKYTCGALSIRVPTHQFSFVHCQTLYPVSVPSQRSHTPLPHFTLETPLTFSLKSEEEVPPSPHSSKCKKQLFNPHPLRFLPSQKKCLEGELKRSILYSYITDDLHMDNVSETVVRKSSAECTPFFLWYNRCSCDACEDKKKEIESWDLEKLERVIDDLWHNCPPCECSDESCILCYYVNSYQWKHNTPF